MAGFPRIPSRADFGPLFQNRHAVRNRSQQADAATMNLLAWQVAGASRTVPRAMAFMGATGVLGYHVEAWATYATGSPTAMAPTAGRSGAGVYHFRFGRHFPDEAGATSVFQPLAAMAFPQGVTGATGALGATTFVNGQLVGVTIRSSTGSGVDVPFILTVW